VKCKSINPETGSQCEMGDGHFGPHCTGSPYLHAMQERWVTKCPGGSCDYHETFMSNPRHEQCITCGDIREVEECERYG